ncbi:Scr1 family TA system antitoxin-like transcriptional regulator [Kitasatospora sp. NPDC057518]|uniref:Scr1 family TA system antitoxin-like transcriptional regulator n=1 Tax=Kitasatospora sp. NPDC057518 TaxID=3346155 RepID=UPI0036B762EE
MAGRKAQEQHITLTPSAWAWLLRSNREKAGIDSCAALARRTFSHPSYVQKVESRERPPSRPFAVECDKALGTGQQMTDAWDRVDWDAEPQYPGWFELYADLESRCRGIRGHDVRRVWGLLQTPAYARALTQYVMRGATPAKIEETVAARLARQQRFLTPNGPTLVSIVDEAVIRQVVGGPLGPV